MRTLWCSPVQRWVFQHLISFLSFIATSWHIYMKLSNSISPHADHLLSPFLIRHSLQLSNDMPTICASTTTGESRGICCSNGQQLVLIPLPPPPRELVPLYEGNAERFQRFRRMDRKYNSSSNFCAMCVEDGELKRMFGPHFLSVQGR